ncbi:hypothetical protein M378DRAFT_162761, partial [Amanita muscaria Koide BX008]
MMEPAICMWYLRHPQIPHENKERLTTRPDDSLQLALDTIKPVCIHLSGDFRARAAAVPGLRNDSKIYVPPTFYWFLLNSAGIFSQRYARVLSAGRGGKHGKRLRFDTSQLSKDIACTASTFDSLTIPGQSSRVRNMCCKPGRYAGWRRPSAVSSHSSGEKLASIHTYSVIRFFVRIS